MFNSIKSKIFVSHFILISLLLAALSYKHYINALDSYIENVITFHKNSSNSIVRTSSLAISGHNYGNIQLPSFLNELSSNSKLLYLKIVGKSDYSSKVFSAVYDKDAESIYRNNYPKDYEVKLQKKIDRFRLKLNDPKIDKVKLNFLIKRTNDSLDEYKQNISYKKNENSNYIELLKKQSPYVDFNEKKLFLSFKTNNKNSGLVSMIYDISEISKIKNQIIKDLIIEALVSLMIAIIFLNILANRIIGPLNKLSQFLSKSSKNLDPQNIPALDSKDEIAYLSSRFKVLIEEIKEKQEIIESKAYFDNLTGLYNRNKFDELFDDEIIRVKRYKEAFTIAVIDIDKFKNLNDNYGHLIGDEVLILMSHHIRNNTRDTDVLARWGGEEFIIMFRNTSVKEANIKCNDLRISINNLVHSVAGNITVSFGISEYKIGDTQKSLFKRCDDALYKAKENGRDQVCVTL